MQAAKALRQQPQKRDKGVAWNRPRSAPGGGRKRPKSGFSYVFDIVEDENRMMLPDGGAFVTSSQHVAAKLEADGRREYRPPAQQFETLLERFEAVPVGPVISASRNGWANYFMSKRKAPSAPSRAPSASKLRGPGPGGSEGLLKLWNRLEDLWEECKIPEADRAKFSALHANDEVAVARHVRLCLEHRSATIHVLRCIRQREACVGRLKGFIVESDADAESSESQTKPTDRAFLTALVEARDASLEVVLAVQRWREHLTGNYPFIWKGENYLLKMMADLNILGEGGSTGGAGLALARLGMSSADLLLLHFPGGASSMLSQYGVLASDDVQKHAYWESERTAATMTCTTAKDLKKELVHAAISVQSEAVYVLNEKRGLNAEATLLQWNLEVSSLKPGPSTAPMKKGNARPKSAGVASQRSRFRRPKGALQKEKRRAVSDLIISSGQTVLEKSFGVGAKGLQTSDNAASNLTSVPKRKVKKKKKRPTSVSPAPGMQRGKMKSSSSTLLRRTPSPQRREPKRLSISPPQRPRSAQSGEATPPRSSPLRGITNESRERPPPSQNKPFRIQTRLDPKAEQSLLNEIDRISPPKPKKKTSNLHICISNICMVVRDPFRDTNGLFATFELNGKEESTPILSKAGSAEGDHEHAPPSFQRGQVELTWVGRLVLPAPEKVLRNHQLIVRFCQLSMGRVEGLAQSKLKLDMLAGALGSDMGALTMKVEPKSLKTKLSMIVESITAVRAEEDHKEIDPSKNPQCIASGVLIQSIWRRAVVKSRMGFVLLRRKVFPIAMEWVDAMLQRAILLSSAKVPRDPLDSQSVPELSTKSSEDRVVSDDGDRDQLFDGSKTSPHIDIHNGDLVSSALAPETVVLIATEGISTIISDKNVEGIDLDASSRAEGTIEVATIQGNDSGSLAARACLEEVPADVNPGVRDDILGNAFSAPAASESERNWNDDEDGAMTMQLGTGDSGNVEPNDSVGSHYSGRAFDEGKDGNEEGDQYDANSNEKSNERGDRNAIKAQDEAEDEVEEKNDEHDVVEKSEVDQTIGRTKEGTVANEGAQQENEECDEDAQAIDAAHDSIEQNGSRLEEGLAEKEESNDAGIEHNEPVKANDDGASSEDDYLDYLMDDYEEEDHEEKKGHAEEEPVAVKATVKEEVPATESADATAVAVVEPVVEVFTNEDPREDEAKPVEPAVAVMPNEDLFEVEAEAVEPPVVEVTNEEPPEVGAEAVERPVAAVTYEEASEENAEPVEPPAALAACNDDDYDDDSFVADEVEHTTVALMADLRSALARETVSSAELFQRFCKDGRDFISFTSLCNNSKNIYGIKLAAAGDADNQDLENSILACIDTSGTGQIPLRSFEAFITNAPENGNAEAELGSIWVYLRQLVANSSSSGKKAISLESLDSLFKKYDESRAGVVKLRAVKRALQKLGREDPLSKEQLKTLESHFGASDGAYYWGFCFLRSPLIFIAFFLSFFPLAQV